MTSGSMRLSKESGQDAEFIVSGERTKEENLCAFPLNPEQKENCEIYWNDWPQQEFRDDSPYPLAKTEKRKDNSEIE